MTGLPVGDVDRSSTALARRALFITGVLALAGSALGLIGIGVGSVTGLEIVPIVSCALFAVGILVALLVPRNIELQLIATVSTIFFTLYLCTGALIAISPSGHHQNLFVYLVWFFPLLVYNKLVNAPAIAAVLAKTILLAPLVIVGCSAVRLFAVFKPDWLIVIAACCLSNLAAGLTLDIVTRFREKYIVERARVESLELEAEVLESISDCFIALDSGLRLIYLNDAACREFGVLRTASFKDPIPRAVPGFFSVSMVGEIRAAFAKPVATTFEAQNDQDNWYEMRCFPQPDGMSIFFTNITEAVSSRQSLNEAHARLREQAELLDKAQDAIVVQDMDQCVIYWNKGAERLYGWTALEVAGKRLSDVFPAARDALDEFGIAVLEHGEWNGELGLSRRDGSGLIVESRCTLVHAADGRPRSILAINTDITNRKAAEAKIARLAFFDVLTDLPNRLLLRERLEETLAAADPEGDAGALLVIDLNDFKTLNDTLGHDIGDTVLARVADRLTSSMRPQDTVARLGGDVFAVLIEQLSADVTTAAAEAAAIGDTVLEAFLAPYKVDSHECVITASIGIALFDGPSASADELLARADLAMYRAKAQGRHAMCFFDPAMATHVASRAALLADLRRALQHHEFELYYQPQVDRHGRVIGSEALLRWPHPRRGFVSPAEFIPLAEEAGLIVELGRWVLETACAQLAAWAGQPGMEHLTVAVNVSVRQFLDSDFVSLVRDVLETSGANPERLKLEITESTMMEDVDDTIAKMTALKAYSVGFSLDDFGTGYSSLSYLKRLPLDQLKIDQSFVRDVLADAKDASIAGTIIALGQKLNLAVIAEGVETQAQRDFLLSEGCHVYQGYLFSKALPAAEFGAYVAAAAALQDKVYA